MVKERPTKPDRGIAKCQRCLLDNTFPSVTVQDDGICSVCKTHDKLFGRWDETRPIRGHYLNRLFDKCRNLKRAYDVVLGFSGGKDSTYSLYVCKKQFGLRCLAVTFDNGFLTENARVNIKKTVDALGVDHVFYRPNWDRLQRLYRYFFRKTGHFCPVCMGGLTVAQLALAKAFEIPLIVQATSRRTEEFVSREYFIHGDPSFLHDVYSDDPAMLLEGGTLIPRIDDFSVERMAGSSDGYKDEEVLPRSIMLPDYMDWNPFEFVDILREKLGWRSDGDAISSEHMDCAADPIVNYMRHRKFPALVPEKLKISKLVTVGFMSRDEALNRMEGCSKNPVEPKNIVEVLQRLGISREEFEGAMRDKLRHLKYAVPLNV